MTRATSPAGDGAACRLRGIGKCYRVGGQSLRALDGVDLDLAAGELVALSGPSGSGKSTLLNICGLIDAPDQGELVFLGHDARALCDRARTRLRRESMGFVFQSFNLVPVMSAHENVDYPLFLMGLGARERRRRVEEMLERVGLSGLGGRRPDALSGGQRQRVAVARALIKQPRLVIADEPTANLDSRTAAQVIALLSELCHAGGAACLVATHDPELARCCDRVLSIRDGRVEAPAPARLAGAAS